LPWCGTPLTLQITVRRFVCDQVACPRRIFAERFPNLVTPYARQTSRWREALRAVGFALGGTAGARLADKLGMGTSGKTILCLVQGTPLLPARQPRVVGIDDWSWRRGHRYGTILVDLERHALVDLLPDRSAETVATWLTAHPGVEIVSRDRGGLYAEGARRGAPQAIQVADRWHLVDNLVDALERFLLHKSTLLKATAAQLGKTPVMVETVEQIQTEGGGDVSLATTGAPDCPTPCPTSAAPRPLDEMYPGRRKRPHPRDWLARAEAESLERHAARIACYERIQALATAGADKADIARAVGVSRKTVYRYLALPTPPERRQPKRRGEVLEPWKPYLLRRWAEGCHTALRLWREICDQGYSSSSTTVTRFAARIRRGEIVVPPPAGTVTSRNDDRVSPDVSEVRPLTVEWSARRVASLLVSATERLSEAQTAFLRQICAADPTIDEASHITTAFLRLVRERAGADLESWMTTTTASSIAELRRFACGLGKDKAAVQAGLTLCWSNGQVEGQVHRLKLLKRQMYGRAGFDLLRRRVLQPA